LPDAVPFALLRAFVNTGVGQRNWRAHARPCHLAPGIRTVFFRRNAAFNFNAIFISRAL